MKLMEKWNAMKRFPAGNLLFSKLLGTMVPYSGTIKPEVIEMEPGFTRVRLRDRRGVRNHLKSIHAIALMNLGELSSGLAVNSALGANQRGIVTKLSIEYFKKARGTLESECRVILPSIEGPTEFKVPVDIRNAEGDVVCRAEATWLLDNRK